jgi:hypothetical protein
MEIYKWIAVKHFQDHFDINAPDFHKMLAESLEKTSNLLLSGNYFPRGMIILNAEKTPEWMRTIFNKLYNLEINWVDRINDFSSSIKEINKINFKSEGYADYQDDRAIIAYLNLMYPEENYFYKFGMFKKLVSAIDYHYIPKAGKSSNITQFYSVSDILKKYLIEDNEIIRLHQSRLGADHYLDTNFNILTQDFIYAITEHLTLNELIPKYFPQLKVVSFSTKIGEKTIKLRGNQIDYVKKARLNKHIGDLGELLALQYEIENANEQYAPLITHDSKDIGDGLGYDILSYDNQGNKKFIEVKTTSSNFNNHFFITASELQKSLEDKDNYYLYRIYNFNAENNSGDLFIINGDLSRYCNNPIQYEVILDEQ